MEKTDNFTVEQGIKIQSEQLALYEMVLKPNYFILLKYATTKDNHKSRTGYDVVRGVQIDNILHNIMLGHQLEL